MNRLSSKKLWVLDMDGTVYLGERLFDGTLPFLERIKNHGARRIFFTNNASRAKETYVTRLRGMGIIVEKQDIMTSGDTTIAFLKKNRPGASVYLVGTPDLTKQFADAGINLVEDGPADCVVVSFDTTLTYQKLEIACRLIREGAEFLSTHPDYNCPVEGGFIPDSGAICALVTASTGKLPKYFGKPYEDVINMIELETGIDREDMVFVGDRLYTDIAVAKNHGVCSVLVLSGETTLEDLTSSDIQPDFVVNGIEELLIET